MSEQDVPPDEVFDRVQECLRHLVSGSGHLSEIGLTPESFELTSVRELDSGLTEYAFTAEGSYVSEFHLEPLEPEPLSGTIVLDADGELTFDDDGRVRIDPWQCVHPSLWGDLSHPAYQREDFEALTTGRTEQLTDRGADGSLDRE